MKTQDDIEKNTPFNVPEGYFENFSDNLMGKIQPETVKSGARIFSMPKQLFKRAIAIAAAIAVLLVVSVLFFKYPSGQLFTDNNSMELNSEDYAVLSEDFDFSEDEILDFLSITEDIDTETIISNL